MFTFYRFKRYKCYENIGINKRKNILKNFYEIKSKDLQDSHLTCLTTITSVKQQRSRKREQEHLESDFEDQDNEISYMHSNSFYFKVRVEYNSHINKICICRNAFLSFYGTTMTRLRRRQSNLALNNKSRMDNRDKHQNRPKATTEPVKMMVDEHVRKFKPQTSHYSLRKKPNKRYFPETLNFKNVHRMFLTQCYINVPYKLYLDIFNIHNILFG